MKQKSEKLKLEFPMKVNEHGDVFNSITAHDIENELSAHGIRLVKVVLQKPLRILGKHPVRIDFGHGIKTDIHVLLKASIKSEAR